MEIFLEKQPNCIAVLRASVPAATVQEKLDKLAEEYRKVAKLPGFRPGKAPLGVVARKHKDAIGKEAVKELLREAVDRAARDNGVRPINAFNLEHGEVGDGDLNLTVQITLEPDFELPDLESLSLDVPGQVVTDAHVESQINVMLERLAEFTDITGRPLQMGDYAVLDYDASIDGKPLHEVCPEAPSTMKGGEGLWVIMDNESMWPGFCAGLEGALEDEEREVEITVPEDFAVAPLRGKTIKHRTKVKGIKAKKLPELNDEVAQKVAGRNADDLRAGIRERLEAITKDQIERSKRAAAVEHLVQQVQFEVPASFVISEARRVVREIVEAEQTRGLSDEELLSKKDEIFDHAKMGAQFRVRADFILDRVARTREITASREELAEHIARMAARLNMSMDKLVKQLVKREALGSVEAEVIRDKALDFLASKVNVKAPDPAS